MAGLISVVCLVGLNMASAVEPAAPGQPIDRVTLTSIQGKSLTVAPEPGKKAAVIVFLSFNCPVSTSYSNTLVELVRQNPLVSVIGICPDPDETEEHLRTQAKAFGLTFPVVLDSKQEAVKALGATITPEAFVVDANNLIRYHGRIDNGYAARLKKNNRTTREDLKLALAEVLSGKPVSEPVTKAVGCTIEKRVAKAVAKNTPTYHRDVEPILQKQCQTCHRPGEVGPFSLMTYSQAVRWADDIKDFTQSRKMPPWKPTAGPGFHDQRQLSSQELTTLVAWIDGGTPEGNPADAPPPRTFVQGWQLGQPDLVLTLPADFHLGPDGRDLFRVFILPTDLPEDKDIAAVELRPSNPRVVHHVLVAIDTTGQGRRLDEKEAGRKKEGTEADHGPGYNVAMGFGFFPQAGMGGWAPGQVPRYLPEGTGYRLPKGADVALQVHFHRDGKAEIDRTQIGLYFAKKPVVNRYQSLPLRGNFLVIPKNVESHKITGSAKVDRDGTLYSVLPHMHMLGKAIKVTMTPPEGKPETLINIDDWDYNWQETYFFREPIQVKAGTRFEVEAVYDNSASNPRNPNDPPRPVRFGEQTTDEMCFVFLGGANLGPNRRPGAGGGALLDRLRQQAPSEKTKKE